MIVQRYTTAREFLAQTQEYLEQQEVINSLPLGLCLRMSRGTEQPLHQPFFAALFHDNTIVAVALRTPPHHPIIVCNTNDRCQKEMELLARVLIDEQPDIAGVAGRVPAVQFCAEAMAAYSKRSAVIAMQMRLYKATKIVPATPCQGGARLATLADADILTVWTQKFSQETLQTPMAEQKIQSMVADRILRGEISVWDNGSVVSMAAKVRSTRTTASVASVYTPKEYRGHGYATANVAALSQQLLATGYSTCVLFTDTANPTSNAIYQRIGYQPVCDFTHYKIASL